MTVTALEAIGLSFGGKWQYGGEIDRSEQLFSGTESIVSMGDHPNILLVILDSVRASNLGLYGHDAANTPFLEEFAEEASVFTQARSPGIHSIASHVSLFTGYSVPAHQVTQYSAQITSGHTIWETLQDEYGYETGLFTPNVIVSESSNLSEFFQTVVGPKNTKFRKGLQPGEIEDWDHKHTEFIKRSLIDEHPIRSLLNGVYSKLYTPDNQRDFDEYVTAFDSWVGDTTGSWAACINLMDAHYPYDPRPEHDQWGGPELRDMHKSISYGPQAPQFVSGKNPWWKLKAFEALYDGAIHQLDTGLRELIALLRRKSEFEDTFIVITSDHGEGFGETSRLATDVRLIDHGWGIGERLTHVPLIVKEPGQERGETVKRLAQIRHFPSAVEAAISGENGYKEFIPADGETSATTYRIEDDTNELLNNVNTPENYLGPWHAEYRQKEESIEKTMVKRGSNGVRIRINRNGEVQTLENDMDIDVSDFVEGVERSRLARQEDDSGISEDVANQLNELGYIE